MPGKFLEQIKINPARILGKPIIKRKRIPVELLLRKLSGDATSVKKRSSESEAQS